MQPRLPRGAFHLEGLPLRRILGRPHRRRIARRVLRIYEYFLLFFQGWKEMNERKATEKFTHGEREKNLKKLKLNLNKEIFTLFYFVFFFFHADTTPSRARAIRL